MSETRHSIVSKLKAEPTIPKVDEPVTFEQQVSMTGLQTFANDAAAGSGGLVTGDLFILTATAAITVKA